MGLIASNVNDGYGINDWTQADLMQELNEDYLNTNLSANTMWYLGGQEFSVYNAEGEGSASKFYEYERGTTVWGSKSGQTCNDGACPRSTNWTGKVALAYPSDYGFAVGEDVRSTCLGKRLGEYGSDNCHTSQWLLSSGWLLSPSSSNSYFVYSANSYGLHDLTSNSSIPAVPAVYLKSDVTISGGNGSVSEPYQIN